MRRWVEAACSRWATKENRRSSRSRGSCGRGTCHAGQNARGLPKAPTTGLGSKGKLLILFAVLGVLALAMVLFVIFASHK